MYQNSNFQKSTPASGADRASKSRLFQVVDGGRGIPCGTPKMHAVDPLDTGLVQVVTSDPKPYWHVTGWLDAQDIGFTMRASMTPLADCQVMLIDFDSFGATDQTIDELRRLRNEHPDVWVILVSWAFGRDDFSTDRLPIADVCLRGPVSFARLELALVEAEVNNAIWQGRLNELAALEIA